MGTQKHEQELTPAQVQELEERALGIRRNVVRMLYEAGSGHLGGSLSTVDVLLTLYRTVMHVGSTRAESPDRDRFVLSIGHVVPAHYAVLADSGYFPEEELWTLRKLGSRLQGHPARGENPLPGIDVATGSLGQGLSVGVGLALAARLTGRNYRTFVLLGDGELQEGQVWEAAMSASARQLTELTAIVDRNRVQIDGRTERIMPIEPLADKWRSFGWEVRTCDAPDFRALHTALSASPRNGQPVVVLANSLMGAGIPSIEDQSAWHGKVPTAENYPKLIEELEMAHSGRLERLRSTLRDLPNP